MAGALRRKAFRRFVHLLTESGNPALLSLILHWQEFALLARPCFHFVPAPLPTRSSCRALFLKNTLSYQIFNAYFWGVPGLWDALPKKLPQCRIKDLCAILGIYRISLFQVAQLGRRARVGRARRRIIEASHGLRILFGACRANAALPLSRWPSRRFFSPQSASSAALGRPSLHLVVQVFGARGRAVSRASIFRRYRRSLALVAPVTSSGRPGRTCALKGRMRLWFQAFAFRPFILWEWSEQWNGVAARSAAFASSVFD